MASSFVNDRRSRAPGGLTPGGAAIRADAPAATCGAAIRAAASAATRGAAIRGRCADGPTRENLWGRGMRHEVPG
ncbi:hypothetical protein [Micromonospora rifamycinica]|uniref:hypothetical protein n=1 Tax=Micromonospora rifamycinica TaxID=291594 RepID=UPI00082A78B2|nr:hypothetical protein [Micromonospora rifamycinica]